RSADHAEMAKRQMRNEAPGPTLLQRQPQGGGRGGETGNACHSRGAFDQAQRWSSAAERQHSRQISVAAQRIYRQHGAALLLRVERRVVGRQEHGGAADAPDDGAAGNAVEATDILVRAFGRIGAGHAMKRAPRPQVAAGQGFANALDRPDLETAGTPGIWL